MPRPRVQETPRAFLVAGLHRRGELDIGLAEIAARGRQGFGFDRARGVRGCGHQDGATAENEIEAASWAHESSLADTHRISRLRSSIEENRVRSDR
jgi:hypothetical protein